MSVPPEFDPPESLIQPKPSDSKHRVALLVEDSVATLEVLKFMLVNRSFDVVCATNGEEAVEKFKQQSFDVVVMDIQMPLMDGLEATRQMRAHEETTGTRTPIVAVTAGMDRGSCMKAGMDGYLEKPVHPQGFHEVLESACPTGG